MKTLTWFLCLALLLPQVAFAEALETLNYQTSMDSLGLQLKDLRKAPGTLSNEIFNGTLGPEVISESAAKERWIKRNREGKTLIADLKKISIESSMPNDKACKSFKNTVHTLRDAYANAGEKVTDINLSNPDLLRGFACLAFGKIGDRPQSNCNPAFSKDAMKMTVGAARMRVLRRQLETARLYYLLGLDELEGTQWSSRDNITHMYVACQPKQPSLALARIDQMREQFKKIEERLWGVEGKNQIESAMKNLDYIKKEYETVRDTDRLIDLVVMIAGPSVIISAASKVFSAAKVALNVRGIVGAILFRMTASSAVGFIIRPHRVTEGLQKNSKMVLDLLRDKETFEKEIERYTDQRDLMGQDLNYLKVLLSADIESRKAELDERQKFADYISRLRTPERNLLRDQMTQGLQEMKAECPKCNVVK